MQRPAPRPSTPDRDRAIFVRSWIILTLAIIAYLAALLPNLWPALTATADVVGLH